ncbi:TIGR04076 family protein [Candidatus Sumerlaeota bacterium]|nr:TIGR04076 family protein [Candidatus Sumerlaeota bacterium]
MAQASPVRMRIISIAGKCPNGHQVGEEYLVQSKTPAGICLGSFSACIPYLTALRFGASFPWEDEEGVITLGCPDHINQVVWRLERE